MTWTKQTKIVPTEAADGWGDLAWGSGAWGSPSGTAWTKISSVIDSWFVSSVYDSNSFYDSNKTYDGSFIITWTKVPNAT